MDNIADYIIRDGTPTPIYICDPKKNTSCVGRKEKDWCGVECKCTFHKEFAKDEHVT